MKKDKELINKVCDLLVFGQLFVDELGDFEGTSIFRNELKFWSNKVLAEFRKKLAVLWGNINKKDVTAVTKLYDINYMLLDKLNGLTIDDKLFLVDNFDTVFDIVKNKGKVSYKDSDVRFCQNCGGTNTYSTNN